MNKAKNPGYESGLCCFSLARYLQKCVTHIYRALYGDAIYLCPSEGHKHGSRKVRDTEQKHLSLSFAIETNNNITALELRHIERNVSSSASTVQLAKTKVINF